MTHLPALEANGDLDAAAVTQQFTQVSQLDPIIGLLGGGAEDEFFRGTPRLFLARFGLGFLLPVLELARSTICARGGWAFGWISSRSISESLAKSRAVSMGALRSRRVWRQGESYTNTSSGDKARS